MRTTLVSSEDTKIKKQGWTKVRQARHLEHTGTNLRVSTSLNFAPEVFHLLHPGLSPRDKTSFLLSRIFSI